MSQSTSLSGILFGKCKVKIDHRKRNKKLEIQCQYESILKYNELNLDAYSLPIDTDESSSESMRS